MQKPIYTPLSEVRLVEERGRGHKWVNGVAVPDSGPGVQGYEDAVQGKSKSSSDPDYVEGYSQGQQAQKEGSTFYRSSGDMLTGRGGGKDDPVGEKIKKLMDEGKDQDQAVAIALSMERQGTLGRGLGGGALGHEDNWMPGSSDKAEGGNDQATAQAIYQSLNKLGVDTENCSFTTQGALLVQSVMEGRISVDQAARKIASDQGRYLTYGSY